jgi:hypothetical protein
VALSGMTKMNYYGEGYSVRCNVSGMTGSRSGWLKKLDGSVRLFETEAEAQAEAARLMSTISPHSSARFTYYAAEFTPAY